jgi:uncharacterized damage-inducible protein DinB
MSTVSVEFFKHNLWANLRLLDACSTLGDEHLSASVPGTYGSVRDTLVHIFGAEGRYVSRITRGEVVRPTPESAGFSLSAASQRLWPRIRPAINISTSVSCSCDRRRTWR